MSFLDFAQNHGLLIHHVYDDNKIHRVKTKAKPNRSNGAYQYDGLTGWIQDWTIHEDRLLYRPDKQDRVSQKDLQERSRLLRQAKEDERTTQLARARLAQSIVSQCSFGPHNYLTRKGFEIKTTPGKAKYAATVNTLVDYNGQLLRSAAKETGMFLPDGAMTGDILVVPVHAIGKYGFVQSVQFIDNDGHKLFLKGARMKGGVLFLGSDSRTTWLCEGLASGMSLLAACKMGNLLARVGVCFSASNLIAIAKQLGDGDIKIFADNDKINPDTGCGAGEHAAKLSNRRYCMSPVMGEDCNDLHTRTNVFEVLRVMQQAGK